MTLGYRAIIVSAALVAGYASHSSGTVESSRTSPGPSKVLPLSKVGANTKLEKTAKITERLTLNLAGTSAIVTSEGVGDLVTGSGSYILNLSQFVGLGGNQQLPGYIRDSFVHTDWVVLDGVGYLKSQFIELYSHKKWTKVVFDPHHISRQNPLTSQYPSALTQDPTANMDLLGDVGDDTVETIGTENIGGVSVVHYRAALDLAALQKSAANNPELATLIAEFKDAKLKIDVWVDEQARLRRVRYDLKGDPLAAFDSEPLRQTIETNFSDFGIAVQVAAPPPGDVGDLDAIANATNL